MQLLKSESPTEFEEKYTVLSNIWSKEFDSYFLGQKDDLQMFATRYNIEPWKIYNPNSGITNNVAESLKAVIKHLLNWKEVPVDCLCLSLYYL